jgi:hypothetical protein
MCTLSLIFPAVCFVCSIVSGFSIELYVLHLFGEPQGIFFSVCIIAIVIYQLSVLQCHFMIFFMPRSLLYCIWLAQERASSRLDQGTSQFVPSNNNSTETLSSTSRPRVTVNDRLPGAVVLARARLLERLRGVSLSGNR